MPRAEARGSPAPLRGFCLAGEGARRLGQRLSTASLLAVHKSLSPSRRQPAGALQPVVSIAQHRPRGAQDPAAASPVGHTNSAHRAVTWMPDRQAVCRCQTDVQGTFSNPAPCSLSSAAQTLTELAGRRGLSWAMKHGEIPRRFPSPGEGHSRGYTRDPEVTALQSSFWCLWHVCSRPCSAQRVPPGRARGPSPRHVCAGWPQPVPAPTLGCSSMENGVFYLYVSGFI